MAFKRSTGAKTRQRRIALRRGPGKMAGGGPVKPKTAASSMTKRPRIGVRKSKGRVARERMGFIGAGATFGRTPKMGGGRLSHTAKPGKIAGPPKVGMRTVKGRRGKKVTIKRPGKRIVGPPESHAIGKSPKRRTGRRVA